MHTWRDFSKAESENDVGVVLVAHNKRFEGTRGVRSVVRYGGSTRRRCGDITYRILWGQHAANVVGDARGERYMSRTP